MGAIEAGIIFLGSHGVELLLLVGARFAAAAAGIGAVAYALVQIPEDYLERQDAETFWPKRLGGKVGKNIVGVLLIASSVVPGVPGLGVFSATVGLILVDIPGKERLVHRVIAAPEVLRQINRLRAHFGRSPLRVSALSPV